MDPTLRNQAQTLLNNNDFTGALALFQQMSQQDSNNVEVWFMIGTLSARTGQLDQAETALRRAITLQPGLAEAHDSLGGVLQEQDKPDQAIPCHQTALKLSPDYMFAHYNLGNAYRKLEQYDRAVPCYRKMIQSQPGFVDAHVNLANALRQLGKFREAGECYQQVVDLDPDNVDAWANLGYVEQLQGNNELAMARLHRALELDPGHALAKMHMATIQRERGLYQEAIQLLNEVISSRPEMQEAHGLLGNVFIGAGRFDDAIAAFQKMLELDSRSVDAGASISAVLEKQGKYQQAYDRLQPLLAETDSNVNAEVTYGLLSGHFSEEKEAIRRLKKILERKNLTAGEKERILFGLGRLCDKQGYYKEAFRFYRKGNEIRHINYNHDDTERLFSDLIGVFTPDFLSNKPATSGLATESPVFIVGMPRSGTSLVEQILSSHAHIHGAGELDLIIRSAESLPQRTASIQNYPQCVASVTEQQLQTVAREYLDHITALAPDAARVTDKMPHNFLHLGLIQLLFPQARVIHCERDPIDTCLSCYFNQFGDRHPYSQDLVSLGKYYLLYDRLMKHWKQVLKLPIMSVNYEQLVENQEAISKQLVDFCGLEWDDNCLSFHKSDRVVATASYDQVRQPMYKTSLKRWQKYQKFLQPLIDKLATLEQR